MSDEARPPEGPRFACDAMLAGLARWLRAAGYDACLHPDLDAAALVRLARDEGRTLLTTDTDIGRFPAVRAGLPVLRLSNHASPQEQLAVVLHALGLPLGEPRCMACGGELAEMTREQAEGRVPPRTLAWLDRFWECRGCDRAFWHGSHWQRIREQLSRAAGL